MIFYYINGFGQKFDRKVVFEPWKYKVWNLGDANSSSKFCEWPQSSFWCRRSIFTPALRHTQNTKKGILTLFGSSVLRILNPNVMQLRILWKCFCVLRQGWLHLQTNKLDSFWAETAASVSSESTCEEIFMIDQSLNRYLWLVGLQKTTCLSLAMCQPGYQFMSMDQPKSCFFSHFRKSKHFSFQLLDVQPVQTKHNRAECQPQKHFSLICVIKPELTSGIYSWTRTEISPLGLLLASALTTILDLVICSNTFRAVSGEILMLRQELLHWFDCWGLACSNNWIIWTSSFSLVPSFSSTFPFFVSARWSACDASDNDFIPVSQQKQTHFGQRS